MARRTAKRAKPVPAEPDAATQLRSMADDFLECRDLRHTWAIVGYYREGGYTCRRLQCRRCGIIGTDTWSSAGYRVAARRYQYPDGYQVRGSGGIDNTDVRREVLRRVTVHRSEGSMAKELLGNGGRGSRRKG